MMLLWNQDVPRETGGGGTASGPFSGRRTFKTSDLFTSETP